MHNNENYRQSGVVEEIKERHQQTDKFAICNLIKNFNYSLPRVQPAGTPSLPPIRLTSTALLQDLSRPLQDKYNTVQDLPESVEISQDMPSQVAELSMPPRNDNNESKFKFFFDIKHQIKDHEDHHASAKRTLSEHKLSRQEIL